MGNIFLYVDGLSSRSPVLCALKILDLEGPSRLFPALNKNQGAEITAMAIDTSKPFHQLGPSFSYTCTECKGKPVRDNTAPTPYVIRATIAPQIC